MKQILNIVRKELDKILKNRRLFFSTLILPGLMIFVMYSVMGTVMESQNQQNQEKVSVIQIHNKPASFTKAMTTLEGILDTDGQALNVEIIDAAFDDTDTSVLKKTITEKHVNLYVIFETDFDERINEFLQGNVTNLPVVKVIGSSTDNDSSIANSKISSILELMNTQILADEGIPSNLFVFDQVELATPEELSNMISSMLLPMFIMMFVFAGGMAVGADAIAGEKERGTIATLLIAPIDRNKIVLGKVVSTIVITLMSGICSFIGSFLGIRNADSLFGTSSSGFGFDTSLQLLIVVLSIALLASSLFLIASTFAKTIKEATSYSMPFYIGGIIVSVIPTFAMDLSTNAISYLIPLYNLAITTKGIFLGQISAINFTLAIVSNVVYSGILIYIITKLFKSERLMFQK